MHKNESLYYCYLPNTRSEMIVRVPVMLGEDVEGAYSCLYEKDKPLGKTFFETLSLLNVALPINDKEKVHVIKDEALHDCFERMKEEPSEGKNRLKEYLGNIRRVPEEVDCLYNEESSCQKFAERFLHAEEPCKEDDFKQFCREHRRRIDRGTIVQFELEEFLDVVQTDQSPQTILDFLLRTFIAEAEKKREIQRQIEPYMLDYCDFSAVLKELLAKYALAPELIITCHVYKVSSLFDLFSATMLETINRKRSFGRCRYCRDIFVTGSRTDEKYCSSKCEEKFNNDSQECERRYNVLRNSLSNAYGIKPKYDAFLTDNGIAKEIMNKELNDKSAVGKVGIQKYKAWLEEAFEQNKYEHRG